VPPPLCLDVRRLANHGTDSSRRANCSGACHLRNGCARDKSIHATELVPVGSAGSARAVRWWILVVPLSQTLQVCKRVAVMTMPSNPPVNADARGRATVRALCRARAGYRER